MGTRWRGMLAPLGVSTGDGRRFDPAGVTHRELPLPLKWQRTDESGHDTSVVVGSVDTLTIDKAEVWAEGELFDDADPLAMPRLREDVAEAMLLLGRQVIGPSVDAGAAEAVLAEVGSNEPLTEERLDELWWQAQETGEDPALELLFTRYEIAAATLVPVPAFAQCRPFELLEPALTAAVRAAGWDSLPLADREQSWNGADAAARLAELCGLGGDEPDWACYAAGFLYTDPDANPETKGAHGFGIVDVLDGEQRIVPRGVFAVAASLQGARGGPKIAEDDQTRMREIVAGLYARMRAEFDDDSIVPPWQQDSAALVRTLTASGPALDPAWFEDPQLPGYTPVTMQEVGEGVWRVFGHVATHDTCHVGFRDACVTAPVSASGYRHFHRYVRTAAGVELPVPTGRLTVGHGAMTGTCSCCPRHDDHACTRLGMAQAIAHYDVMRTVAYVCAGEDEANGAIWIAGIVAPEADERDRAALARQKVSGDWRQVGGGLELVEVLVLARERPGFPLPRVAVDSGRPMALTAAGVVRPDRGRPQGVAVGRLADQVADRVMDRLAPVLAAVQPPVQPAPAAPSVAATVADLAGQVRQTVDQQRHLQAAALLRDVERAVR